MEQKASNTKMKDPTQRFPRKVTHGVAKKTGRALRRKSTKRPLA